MNRKQKKDAQEISTQINEKMFKKKTKRNSKLSPKESNEENLGKFVQHLKDFYGTIPNKMDLKNGHIFYIYKKNEKSVSKTHSALQSFFPDKKANIQKTRFVNLINEFNKCKNWNRYRILCGTKFDTTSAVSPKTRKAKSLQLNTPEHAAPASSSKHAALALNSKHAAPASNSSHTLCPKPENSSIEHQFKKRLDFLINSHRIQREFFTNILTKLTKELKGVNSVQTKHLNLSLKRKNRALKVKDATIALLKMRYQESEGFRLQEELKKVQTKHKRLAPKTVNGSRVSKKEFIAQRNKLKEKEKTIRFLESEKSRLFEILKEENLIEKLTSSSQNSLEQESETFD